MIRIKTEFPHNTCITRNVTMIPFSLSHADPAVYVTTSFSL